MENKPEGLTAIRSTCRVCGAGNLTPILALGDLHVSDFLSPGEAHSAVPKYPLELMFCHEATGGCGLLQLKHTVSHETMYRNYWYRSGMNQTMTDELHGIAHTVESLVPLNEGDAVIDIGANDGTLLRGYATQGVERVGFEPAKNLGKYNGVGTSKIFNDFFNHAVWQETYGAKKAKAITAIGMFRSGDASARSSCGPSCAVTAGRGCRR